MVASYRFSLGLCILITFLTAVIAGYGMWTTINELSNRPLTYIEVIAKGILSAPPERLVSKTISDLVDYWFKQYVYYHEEPRVVGPSAAMEFSYPCPLGVKVYVLVEPELELVFHKVSPNGTCTTVFYNPADAPVVVSMKAYSKGAELMVDEAFRTYIVLKWVSENLRYIPDPYKSDIMFTPAETIRRGGGDCEDLALATATMLRALGVDAGIAVVNTRRLGYVADHVAVAVKPSSDSFTTNLRVYFGTTSVHCNPVVVEGFVILDPSASASSTILWCVRYTRNCVRSIVTASEHIRLLKPPP